jgi:hypothetical protein
MTENFVLVKMISGEQVMAMLEYENDVEVKIKYPMLVRTIPSINPQTGKQTENITAAPWCQFVEERIFEIEKRNVLFMNKLHPLVIEQYMQMVDAFEKEVEVKKDSDGQLFWEDEEDDDMMTVDDVKRTISALSSILSEEREEDDKLQQAEKEYKVTFVKGNDTIN